MKSNTSGFQILVAEHCEADAMLVLESLKEQELDCATHVLRGGEKVIAFLKELDKHPNSPGLDLVLLDLHLPKRDGEEIVRVLRSTENYAQTPVIVMTASDAPQDQENAQKHAALPYFQKPSALAEFMKLGTVVPSALSEWKPTHAARFEAALKRQCGSLV